MKILLPIDGSECAQKTLEWAAKTFNPQQTEYYLLEVIAITPDMIQVEYDVTDATKALNKAKKQMEEAGCKVAKIAYIFGDVVERISDYADEIEADQIVIGSHGRTGLGKLFMGSVSIALMERSKYPVTIYRNVERSPANNKAVSISQSR